MIIYHFYVRVYMALPFISDYIEVFTYNQSMYLYGRPSITPATCLRSLSQSLSLSLSRRPIISPSSEGCMLNDS